MKAGAVIARTIDPRAWASRRSQKAWETRKRKAFVAYHGRLPAGGAATCVDCGGQILPGEPCAGAAREAGFLCGRCA